MDKLFREQLYTLRWYGSELIENPGKAKQIGLDIVAFTTDMIEGKASGEEPERKSYHFDVPEQMESKVRFQTRGKYRTESGRPKGLIVHFTAGNTDPMSTARSMQSRGLGCMIMDMNGVIWHGQDWDQVAWHAGRSAHPIMPEIKSMSLYCMGMEIVNPGMLEPADDPDYMKSWFGQEYHKDDLVHITHKKDNMAPGWYLPFTHKQEMALLNFCKMQIVENNEFDIDWILGHDEVAIPSGRKNDPGGALSVTMPELRASLKAYKQSL